uniref:(northern house mosquito) hypothetical protein n=1 Tax=Culex pipiens TaxID=7175 RepID=A0A8D8DD73_CULPI
MSHDTGRRWLRQTPRLLRGLPKRRRCCTRLRFRQTPWFQPDDYEHRWHHCCIRSGIPVSPTECADSARSFPDNKRLIADTIPDRTWLAASFRAHQLEWWILPTA